MYKKIVFPMILVISVISMVIFTSGFINSITITTNNTSKPTEDFRKNETEEVSFTNDKDELDILILGDSIGSGAGDEAGKDIGRRYEEQLDENKYINTINLSQSGSKIINLLEKINEEVYDEIIKNSELIIISIGGNDLKEILDSDVLDLFVDYDNILSKYLNNLKSVISVLREKSNTSQLIFIGLYNPYGETLSQEKIDLLMNWNYETQKLVESYDQIVYIPTYDLFKYNLESYLSIDAFHPSGKGYEAITKRLDHVINGIE